MRASLAAAALAVALSHVPSMSYAQMGMNVDAMQDQGFQWDIIGTAKYALRGYDIIVFPEGGKYVVVKDGVKDKGYESLGDARMRGEHLAMAKPAMKGKKKPMMKEKPVTSMDKDMDQ